MDMGQRKRMWWRTKRCHDFCDVTNRHSNNRDLLLTLRKGNGCPFEHPKIQSHGGRLVGYIDGRAGHPILSGNNHNGFQIHEYSSQFRECHLVEGDRGGQSPGERRVRSGPMSKITNPVSIYRFTLQDKSHSTDFPDPEGARATPLNGNILVYMAWCDFQGAPIKLTKPDGGRRLYRRRSQMPCPLSYQILGPSCQELVADC
jgi:hypothetical protein